jgi:ElaB/YqjD/DUF883 family membrane-anchored ribosome-binding protein
MSATDKGATGAKGNADAKRPLRDGIDDARAHAGDIAAAATDRAHDIASDALATTRETASAARESLSGGVVGNPLLALAGGAALGVVIGALLPRTEKEGAILGAIGARLVDAAREAAEAARETGIGKLDEAGLSRDGARDAVRGILDAALGAAFSAGSAAADAAKHKVVETRD